MQQRSVVIDGSNIAYWEMNPNHRKTIIMLHGLGGDHRGLIASASSLDNFRVIIPDLPGHGLSDRLPGEQTIDNYVKFLSQFHRAIGLNKFYLMGHSFGGAIAHRYARTYPQTIIKLAVFNAVVERSQAMAEKIGYAYIQFASWLPNKIAHWLLCSRVAVYITDSQIMVSKDRATRKKILSEDYLNYRRLSINTLKECLRSLNQLALSDFMPKDCPDILVVAADNDVLVKAENVIKLATYLKDPVIKIIPGGHLLPLESPQVTAELIASQFEV